MKRKPSPAVAISLVALFFSLTGAGFAASGYRITSIWQISPKVRHALVHANMRVPGPAGPQGIPGPQGPQGISGQDGASNSFDTIKFYYRVSAPEALSSDDTVVKGQCDSGDRIINGGFVGQNEIVTTNAPFTVIPAEWDVVAHLDPNATSGSVSVWLVCAVRGT